MSLSINSNISSATARRWLERADFALSRSFAKLSSGLRINSASDDPTGMAVTSSLGVQRDVSRQALLNANDGLSLLSIAEGTTQQLSSVLTRLKELATQAANGSLSSSQRASLHLEGTELTKEYNRLVQSTSFNGQKLLDGSFGSRLVQLGFGVSGSLSINSGAGLSRTVGQGTFANLSNNPLVATTIIATGDFNGDGMQDTVVDAGAAVSFQTSLGNGSGGFSIGGSGSAPLGGITDLEVGDLNGDGKSDVVMVSIDSLSIALSTGTAFTQTDFFSLNASDAALGDFDNDGDIDIALARGNTKQVVIYSNNGSGSFSIAKSFSTGINASKLVAGDFGGDGRVDLALSAGSTQINVASNLGNLSFQASAAHTILTTSANVSILRASDLDRDGKSDLVVGINGGIVQTFKGQGEASFSSAVSYSLNATTGSIQGLSIGDINNDGNPDIVANGLSKAVALIGDGAGTFSVGQSFTPSSGGGAVGSALADFNSDGVLDLVTAEAMGTGFNLAIANTAQSTNAKFTSLQTAEQAREALSVIDTMMSLVQTELGNSGSYQARLEIAKNNLQASLENYAAARSRIVDVDVAEESSRVAKLQVLRQVGTAVLAQANLSPQIALRLLQNA